MITHTHIDVGVSPLGTTHLEFASQQTSPLPPNEICLHWANPTATSPSTWVLALSNQGRLSHHIPQQHQAQGPWINPTNVLFVFLFDHVKSKLLIRHHEWSVCCPGTSSPQMLSACHKQLSNETSPWHLESFRLCSCLHTHIQVAQANQRLTCVIPSPAR